MSDHRTSISPRSGDDHVITDAGELLNVEQVLRDNLAGAAAAAAEPVSRKAKAVQSETPDA